ncbi:sigma-54-dependent Fis family transcriptional regulator [Saccharopolyspora sp. NFXS83]|uniref:sigma-54-dependent Fis family transcriptional regulator n=1 Tax=Saccharopolyspora sp. NFXS83 TaxID=2993560 RepID=UPI00224B2022|nr:helix-turn-helix domain-containing protein [Saccharopolyspora sp. NFXS83]MCX2732747.1 sigma-54-dependent Fis family transcriptional regulator [Saccharopolyspora sp. NFXS83]
MTVRRRGPSQSEDPRRSATTPEPPPGPARRHFLGDAPVESAAVRGPILASWRRSSDYRVDSEALNAPYVDDLDFQGVLVRAASPVLDHLHDELPDQPVSVVLTDHRGYVLDRRTGRPELRDHLDRVCLAPGFGYAERFVGTNGIGTTLESGQATFVYEQEHFTGPLIDLACAGVPIHDPITGELAGVLDVTCFAPDAGPMLKAVAVGAARGIQERLLNHSSANDITLMQEYLHASHRSRDPIIALNADVLMLNRKAQQVLGAQDQVRLLEHLRDSPRQRPMSGELDLPSGARCRVYARQVPGREPGTIARIHLLAPAVEPVISSAPTGPLPGIVGSEPLWRHCCRAVEGHRGRNAWISLEGEPGTGKSSLVRAVCRANRPDRHVRIVDADEVGIERGWWERTRSELLERQGPLVLRAVHRLSASKLTELTCLLDEVKTANPALWVAATVDPGVVPGPALHALRALFPQSVQVPPLRHRIDDLEAIANHLLRQLTKRPESTFSPEALHLLKRRHWPGNITELREVVREVTGRTRSATITAADLPPQCTSQSRRVLTPIESMERDAIVTSLDEAGGNRARAARNLGISRATIYRKITDYDIGDRASSGPSLRRKS